MFLIIDLAVVALLFSPWAARHVSALAAAQSSLYHRQIRFQSCNYPTWQLLLCMTLPSILNGPEPLRKNVFAQAESMTAHGPLAVLQQLLTGTGAVAGQSGFPEVRWLAYTGDILLSLFGCLTFIWVLGGWLKWRRQWDGQGDLYRLVSAVYLLPYLCAYPAEVAKLLTIEHPTESWVMHLARHLFTDPPSPASWQQSHVTMFTLDLALLALCFWTIVKSLRSALPQAGTGSLLAGLLIIAPIGAAIVVMTALSMTRLFGTVITLTSASALG